ncbi:MAG TPA: VWA domain-containing protein [Planctomycetota bacterium]|nr:VWA domain-containing protein [Planctomycetota bacterium]
MGFASYQEDIMSRFNDDNNRSSKRPSAKPSGKPSASPRGKDSEKPSASPRGKDAEKPSPRTDAEKPSASGGKDAPKSRLKDFTVQSARPLPVVLLADVSGSMGLDGKIQALNHAVREMIEAFQDESDLRAEIHVAVITFGGKAHTHLPLAPARGVKWTDLGANGGTPMGAAFELARGLVEDRNTIPGRAYRPTIVLVSDGQPTDSWQQPLKALLESERGSKAFRMALAIGADADHAVLQEFLADAKARVHRADEARQIRQFFQLVTMSVSSRSRSADPNSAPVAPPDGGWDL